MQFHRRSIRLSEYDYSSYGWYYVTICTYDRELYFGDVKNGCLKLSKFGKIAQKYLLQISEHFKNTKIDKYIVMPNHVHAIVIIQDNDRRGVACNAPTTPTNNAPTDAQNDYYSKISPKYKTLGTIIRSYKSAVTKYCRENYFKMFSWQRNYYERIIRNHQELSRIRNYIINNPKNWETDRNNPKNFQIKN